MENNIINFDYSILPHHLLVKSAKGAKRMTQAATKGHSITTIYNETGRIELPIGNMLLSVYLREIA